MKRKIKLFTSLGIITTTLVASTSCGTSWIKWRPSNNKDQPSFIFHHDTAPPNLWKTRDDETLLKAWNATTKTINLGLLNNQFEFYKLFGLISKTQQSEDIDANWKQADWSKLTTSINAMKDTDITLSYNGRTSSTTSRFEISSDVQKIVSAFSGYTPNYDKSRPDKSGPGGTTIKWDANRAYDVEYDGLNSSGQPTDIVQVAQVGLPLTNNKTVQALLSIDQDFALRLSKLVNIPKSAFVSFTDLMTKFDNFFSQVLIDNVFGAWVQGKNLNFNITQGGKISQLNNQSVSFKGGIIDYILKKEQQ